MGNSCSRSDGTFNEPESPLSSHAYPQNSLRRSSRQSYLSSQFSLLSQVAPRTEHTERMLYERQDLVPTEVTILDSDEEGRESEVDSRGLDSQTASSILSGAELAASAISTQELLTQIKRTIHARQETRTLSECVSESGDVITALMVIQKQNNPLCPFQSKRWNIRLQHFQGQQLWLLSDGKGRVFYALNIEQLLPEAYAQRHSRLVDTLLNAKTDSRLILNELSTMLRRPIMILHPHTKKPLLVQMHMEYNERSQTCTEGAVYFNVTLKRLDSPSISRSSFWEPQARETDSADLGGLLSERKNQQRITPHQMEVDQESQATLDDSQLLP